MNLAEKYAGRITITVKEAAELCGVTPETIRQWAHIPGFPCIRVGGKNGKIIIPLAAFKRWLDEEAARRLFV